MATLERAILASAKVVLKNPKLKMAGILEWSTGEITAQNENEVVVRIPDPGCNICVFKVDDKRTPCCRTTRVSDRRTTKKHEYSQ